MHPSYARQILGTKADNNYDQIGDNHETKKISNNNN